MDELFISTELAAVSTTDFSGVTVEELIERCDALLQYIESVPDFLTECPDPYFQAAAVRIQLLVTVSRYGDGAAFVDENFDRLKDVDQITTNKESASAVCGALSRAAFCFTQIGKRSEALECLHQASIMVGSLDDPAATIKLYIAMSAVYEAFGTTQDRFIALSYADRAAIISKMYNRHDFIPNTLCNLIHLSNADEKYDEALQYGNELLDYLETNEGSKDFAGSSSFASAVITANSNIGDAWLGKGDFDRAEECFARATAMNQESGRDRRIEVALLNGMARVHLERGEPAAAVTCLQSAVDVGTAVNQRAMVRDCYHSLSSAYEADGDAWQALHYAKLYDDLEHELSDESTSENYESLEARHNLSLSIAHNEQLEKTNREEQRLNRALEDKNEALTMYTSIMSHDVRSPLFAIRLCADLIKEDPTSTENVKVQSELISRSAFSIAELIDNLLLHSKTDADVDPEFESIDLNSIVSEVSSKMRSEIDRTNAHITIGELPTVVGDYSLLIALFRNVISNAIRYQPNDNPDHEVTVEIAASPQSVGQSAILVTDNGIGIPDEFVDDLFEPFARFHSGFDGAGLGLTICKRVMDVHDGDIELVSSSDAGTCFRLSFKQRTATPRLET